MNLFLRLTFTPVLVALVSLAFSKALVVTSQIAINHSMVIYFLPLMGMFMTWWNSIPQRQLPKLHELSLHITNQKPTNPWSFLYVFLWTHLSHFFGASVGRESPATIMGLAIAKMLKGRSLHSLSPLKRDYWTEVFLRVGVASGFSAVFGVPIAGAIFALSISPLWRWPIFTLISCFAGSTIAFAFASYLQIPHSSYPPLAEISLSHLSVLFIWLNVMLIGGFYFKVKDFFSKWLLHLKSPLWQGFAGGLILQILIMIFGLSYTSMSLDTLQASFAQPIDGLFFAAKGAVTLVSQLAQFAGGEVTPLMTTAATLANTLVQIWQLPLPYEWSAALAIVCFLTLLLDTPLAMTFLGCELFGWEGFFVFAMLAYMTYVGKRLLWKKTQQSYPSKVQKN